MKDIIFPIFKTKIAWKNKKFDLTDVASRQKYFEYKAGSEIKKLRNYLKGNSFIVYLLGKKNSGKGTYSKMFKEIIEKDLSADSSQIEHISIGDMIRSIDSTLKDEKQNKELVEFIEQNYRGPSSPQELMKSLKERSTSTLLSAELILTLAEREIAKLGRRSIFIDGFPRDFDQVSYSLFFRDLVGYREDPDIFALIDVPSSVIDERIKYRVICSLCQTSRNLKLLPTKKVGYDAENEKFYLTCDNSSCKGVRMVTKEGDELGIGPIKERLKKDENLMKQVYNMYGIDKVFLRNSVPVSKASNFYDDYEITPEYTYSFDKKTKKIKVKERPWKFKDDEGVMSYSLMPPPVVVSLIKQMVKVLGL